MLTSVTLKFTEEPRQLPLDAHGITIFVGPNNSGKSLVLREIERALHNVNPATNKLLESFEIEWLSKEQVQAEIDALRKKRPPGTPTDHVHIGKYRPDGGLDSNNVNVETLINFTETRANKEWIAHNFLRFRMLRLDGRTRFSLTDDKSLGDLLAAPQNAIAHLFTDDLSRKKVREFISDAFGRYFVIDPTHAGNGRIRLSDKAPAADEQSLNEAARKFHQAATHIKDASDGVQAYVGIVMAILSGEFKAIMVDEPEAFLHPPLARKLGKQMASLMAERKGSLFASTHSADFLIGCVQGSKSVQVVRLGYSRGKSKAHKVDSKVLETILKQPLMRSANVISGLFHDGVVVTESDNDGAFYSEIYYRLAEEISDAPSILFVNAQNKQTAKDIVNPLRQFGIPAAAIVDIDVVKDGGQVWTGWMKSIQIPEALHMGYANQRDQIKKRLLDTGKDMKRDGGVEILGSDDKKGANKFFDDMDSYGLFAVRGGELEHWLPSLDAEGTKTDWVISALTKMGSDPEAADYLEARRRRRLAVYARSCGLDQAAGSPRSPMSQFALTRAV